MGLKYHLTFEVCSILLTGALPVGLVQPCPNEVILWSPAQMFTNKKNNAKVAWDYGRDPVCEGSQQQCNAKVLLLNQ